MTRQTRALAFPRAFSIMVGELTGKVVDVLRVLASTKTYRASVADVTRRLLIKGMAVEAVEYALTYRAGRPVELTTGLLEDVHKAMGEEFGKSLPSGEPDVLLQAVLSRMWPEVVTAMEKIDTRTEHGKNRHRKLLAGPPLTSTGRPPTSREIRDQALADVLANKVKAPRLTPPRDVAEAREQARLQQAADRVAMSRGVSASTLLAQTEGGQAAGLPVPDESAAATGWAQELKRIRGGGK
jgi:hypothetical protein